MKIIIVTVCLVAFTWGAALGQGMVQFRNYYPATTPPIDAPVALSSGQRLNGSNPLWRAALIGGPTSATPASSESPGTLPMLHSPSDAALTWVNFRSGTTPPIADGYVNTGSRAARVIPGVNWGEIALVQMVAWQGDYNTWAEAYAAWKAGTPDVLLGFSNPLTLRLPPGSTSPDLTYLWELNSFTIGASAPSSPWFEALIAPVEQTNAFGFTISAPVNRAIVVEACSDLDNPIWVPLSTNTPVEGAASFSDQQWTNFSCRFYRLRSQ